MRPIKLISVHGIQDLQDTEEEVDDIHVKADRSHDVILWWVAIEDQKGIKDNIARENNDTSNSECELDTFREWEKDLYDRHEEKDADTSKKAMIGVLEDIKTNTLSTYNGPIPEKSHLDCKVKRVRPTKTPKVMISAWRTRVCS